MKGYYRIATVLLSILMLLTACQTGDKLVGNNSESSGETASIITDDIPTLETASEPLLEPDSSSNPKSESVSEPDYEADTHNDWQFDVPENHGFDSASLEQLHIALESTEIHSAVTVCDGVIIDEYYENGYDENSVFRLNSVSKSFTSALVGIAIDEGKISGIDVKLSDYLPQAVGTDKADITLRDLLTHTGGFEWYEWGGGYSNFMEWQESENWLEYILGREMVTEPGVTFNYTTGGTHLLTAALQNAVGESVFDYGKERIFEPMGMDSVEWRTDEQGIVDGGNGISMTSRDAAKFGQMFLQDGKWNDVQIVPQSWVEQSTGLQYERPGYDSYGYQWWLRNLSGYDTYFAMGAFGQFIFVTPELDLVTVMTSTQRDNTYLPRDYFRDYVLTATITG